MRMALLQCDIENDGIRIAYGCDELTEEMSDAELTAIGDQVSRLLNSVTLDALVSANLPTSDGYGALRVDVNPSRKLISALIGYVGTGPIPPKPGRPKAVPVADVFRTRHAELTLPSQSLAGGRKVQDAQDRLAAGESVRLADAPAEVRDAFIKWATTEGHYDSVKKIVGGDDHTLVMVSSSCAGPAVLLVYRWEDEVTEEEASRIHLRARAYVSMAIKEVAAAAGIPCQAGPPQNHTLGIPAPAWFLGNRGQPTFLVESNCDFQERMIYLTLGVLILPPMPFSGVTQISDDPTSLALAAGFARQHKRITL
ncbi:MAG TPA: hypothetical protein VMY37_38170 [Thermoguttaceae bacterium]|nr:hypothetical protein [Thermoguttaceae bacterium]